MGKSIALICITIMFSVIVGGAAYVARKGQPGWGWLIFLALVLLTSIKIKVNVP